jgi:GMP synthase-like glutamine amidotransferase
MQIHYLQHVAFEDAANIAAWAETHGHAVSATRLDRGDPLPPPEAFDWLVIMGGPMNVYEHDRYPWLVAEKQFIADAIRDKKLVLGVCLGAQLLADVLGGRVTPNAEKEIGWFPVSLAADARRSPVFQTLPDRFLAFHWHGDTFSIPPGSLHAAQSEACANQAFQYGDRVIGLQFHLDYSLASIEKMIHHCGDELVDAPHIQSSPPALADAGRVQQIQELLYRLLDAMERQVEQGR